MDLIFSYSREQAINDGVLIPIDAKMGSEVGLKVPAAMTNGLYNKYIQTTLLSQDEEGRIWDMLFMFVLSAKGSNSDTILFDVIFQMSDSKTETATLKAIIGPGDHGEPVLTFLLKHED